MSCFNALGTQILTTVIVPKEIFLLQHRVYWEYVKVAVGPDFIHTFPSLLVITGIFILIKKELNLRYFKISNKIVELIIKMAINWIIINAGLWYWMIFQRILYCSIWLHWSQGTENPEIQVPWWQTVWKSYYPPPVPPSPVSPNFISWILSMTMALAFLNFSLHIGFLKIKFQYFSSRFVNIMRRTLRKLAERRKNREVSKSFNDGMTEATDKSEIGSICDECHSEISIDYNNVQPTKISSIANGTNWIPPPDFFKDSNNHNVKNYLKHFNNLDAHDMPNNLSAQLMRNRRNCHTMMAPSSTESHETF